MKTFGAVRLRHDFQPWLEWAERNHVREMFHYTDVRNLPSIVRAKKISARKLLPYYIEAEPYMRSQRLSMERDADTGVDRFVFLSLCNGTPMNHSVEWRMPHVKSFKIVVEINVLAIAGTEISVGIANNSSSSRIRETGQLIDVLPDKRISVEVLVPGFIEFGSILNWKEIQRAI